MSVQRGVFRSVTGILLLLLLLTAADVPAVWAQDGPYQATGFKVGEVTSDSAIVWTRLTLRKEQNPSDAPMVVFRYAAPTQGKSQKELKRSRISAV